MKGRSGMKWAAVSFLILIIVILLLADAGRMPEFLANLYNFPNGDKVGHFLLMGILGFLVNASVLAAFPSKKPIRLVLTSSLILALLAGIEEWSQQFFSHRQASLVDLSSSLAGIAFFAWLAWVQQARKKTNRAN